jgi:nitrite reductase (NADH) small subunit
MSGRYAVCRVEELPEGGRRIVQADRQSIGVFNVGGRLFALINRCPHEGGALCEGPLGGTALPTDDFQFHYGREGSILRCAWHGWEFDVETGVSVLNPRVRVKTYPVEVDGGEIFVLV